VPCLPDEGGEEAVHAEQMGEPRARLDGERLLGAVVDVVGMLATLDGKHRCSGRSEDVVPGSRAGLPAGSESVDHVKVGEVGKTVPRRDRGVEGEICHLLGREYSMLVEDTAEVPVPIGEP
jgi:hypothetical protein